MRPIARSSAGVLALVACSAPTPTAVRITLMFGESWGLDQTELVVLGESYVGPAAPEPLQPGRTIALVMDESRAGEALHVVVWGLSDDERAARGEVDVTPVGGETVDVTVDLMRLVCGDWCASASTRCAGDGVQTCRGEQGCTAWGDPAPCPAGAPFCSFGRCGSACLDECQPGDVRCDGPDAVQACGSADSDTCDDWLPAEPCGGGATCENGVCHDGPCEGECAAGDAACSGAGTLACGQYDTDDCLDWSPESPCPEADAWCSEGACMDAGCADACTASTCDGVVFHRCGQFDGDLCLDEMPAMSCESADPCTVGSCEAPMGCSYAKADCSALDGPCAAGACDGATGKCVAEPVYEGAECVDGDACTTGDVCAAGVCTGAPMVCDDPPDPDCFDPTTRRTYEATGECTDDDCVYGYTLADCAGSCVLGACNDCGDDTCGPGEDCAICPVDCPPPCCGNAICDGSETCADCSQDCGDCDSCADPGECGTAGLYGNTCACDAVCVTDLDCCADFCGECGTSVLLDDPMNCGGCGEFAEPDDPAFICPAPANATPGCSGGVCTWTCDTDFFECGEACCSGVSAPDPRESHVAAWSDDCMPAAGAQPCMIVWGGWVWGGTPFADGRRYFPDEGLWRSMTTGPAGRWHAPAVWTGSEMCVWGGNTSLGAVTESGGCYDPIADAWTATSLAGAPLGRGRHTAVWTGSEMCVWGGAVSDSTPIAAGGCYDPAGTSWSAIPTGGEPSARYDHAAAWSGAAMIVWGGRDSGTFLDYFGAGLNSGGRYDPVGGAWSSVSLAPQGGQFLPLAVWAGGGVSRMIVYAGLSGGCEDDGGRYDGGGDAWTTVLPVASGEEHNEGTAVWTGSEMILHGGWCAAPVNLTNAYDPVFDTWTAIPDSPLAGRTFHTAVWTGSTMIVWGGTDLVSEFGDGAIWDPVGGTWTPF